MQVAAESGAAHANRAADARVDDAAAWSEVSRPVMTKSERYGQILAVLARHGIGVVDDELFKHESGDAARAEHLRRACEELGTVFIKLGRVLSTRGDLLPKAYRIELAKLPGRA